MGADLGDFGGKLGGQGTQRGEVVFLGQRAAARAGLGVLDDVLVVIAEVEPSNVETSAAEQSRVRAEAKIGAVLEINVPKCALGQHAPHVGGLE